ncbi:MAG TPA: MarR family transcriptional regulator [Candidatus Limnocylindrales bacterium]
MTLNVSPSLNSTPSREELVGDVLEALNQISFRDFQGALKRWHEGTLSLVHLNVLMLLRARGPLTMTHLAELIDVSVASATGIVDRMEKKGVIVRRRSEEDRRVVEVLVNESGELIFSSMQAERQVRLNQLLAEIKDADLAALLQGLRAFGDARQRLMSQVPEEARNWG